MRRILYRTSLVIVGAWTLTFLPSPTATIPLRLKNGLVGVFAVLLVGKTVFDSLFYDRYQP